MSRFAVEIKQIRGIEPIANADALEVALVDGWRCVVRKGRHQGGDLAAYLPEASVLPTWLLKRLNLWDADKGQGMLAGAKGDRVKAVRLRGELSQGLLYSVQRNVQGEACLLVDEPDSGGTREVPVRLGEDVAQLLGVVKWEPPVPVAMAGEVFNAGQHLTLAFDVENWKAYPNLLLPGEEVVFTEKLHGTFTGLAVLPLKDAHPEAFGVRRNILVFSKGLGAQGLVFKNNEANQNNLYVRALGPLIERLERFMTKLGVEHFERPSFILGETYGPGVQDLTYEGKLGFRVFAAARGYRGELRYLDWDHVCQWSHNLEIKTVPELYRGPFSVEVMNEYTRGKTTLGAHIREGIVMVPVRERYDPLAGRVALKSISADYLTRKGGSEFN
jgi:RNA ligase (TIGR02306 family)